MADAFNNKLDVIGVFMKFQDFHDGQVWGREGGENVGYSSGVGRFVIMEAVKSLSIWTNCADMGMEGGFKVGIGHGMKSAPKVSSRTSDTSLLMDNTELLPHDGWFKIKSTDMN